MQITKLSAAFVAAMLFAMQALAQGGPPPGAGGRGLPAQVAALEEELSRLRARVAALEEALSGVDFSSDIVPGLGDFVFIDPDRDTDGNGIEDPSPTVVFEGVNVQIIDGTGQTITTQRRPCWPDCPSGATQFQTLTNGLGNLIIGYDEHNLSPFPISRCSNGAFTTQAECVAANEIWAASLKTGTHSLIVGQEHFYSQASNAVFGFRNTVNGLEATVSGGGQNMASGEQSSVGGGFFNTASGEQSSVSGGADNRANRFGSSVSGGTNNTASGERSSVSGGANNTASFFFSSVSGGENNTASGFVASVSGGKDNTARGPLSSVSGGRSRTASFTDDWVAGGLFQDF